MPLLKRGSLRLVPRQQIVHPRTKGFYIVQRLSDEEREELEECLHGVMTLEEFSRAPDRLVLSVVELIREIFHPAYVASDAACDRVWPVRLSPSTQDTELIASDRQGEKPNPSCTPTKDVSPSSSATFPTQPSTSWATCGPTFIRHSTCSDSSEPAVTISASLTVANVSVEVETSPGGIFHDSLRVCNKVRVTLTGGASPSRGLLANTLVDGMMEGLVLYPMSLTVLNSKFWYDKVTEERHPGGDLRMVQYDMQGRLDVRVYKLNMESLAEELTENTINLVAVSLAGSIAAEELQAASTRPPQKCFSPPQGPLYPDLAKEEGRVLDMQQECASPCKSDAKSLKEEVPENSTSLPGAERRNKKRSRWSRFAAGLSQLFCCCCKKTKIPKD